LKNNNKTMKIPLPVPTVAMSKLRAMSCVLISLKTSRLTAQNSSIKGKINVQKSTAGIGSGYVQAQGHEL
jgi:hypothetical protein